MNLIKILLLGTGIITLLPGLLYFAPHKTAKILFKLEFNDEIADFFIRGWGLIISVFGALIISSAFNPELRTAVLLGASVNKSAYAIAVFLQRKKPFTKGLAPSAIMDVIFVIFYLLIIFQVIQ